MMCTRSPQLCLCTYIDTISICRVVGLIYEISHRIFVRVLVTKRLPRPCSRLGPLRNSVSWPMAILPRVKHHNIPFFAENEHDLNPPKIMKQDLSLHPTTLHSTIQPITTLNSGCQPTNFSGNKHGDCPHCLSLPWTFLLCHQLGYFTTPPWIQFFWGSIILISPNASNLDAGTLLYRLVNWAIHSLRRASPNLRATSSTCWYNASVSPSVVIRLVVIHFWKAVNEALDSMV